MADITSEVRAWIDGDPDGVTKSELTELLNAGDVEKLRDRMDGDLEFGTAGLRAVVEAGSNRMNRATVIRTTAGLSSFLLSQFEPQQRLVVVGRDARPSSQVFMEDTIAVLSAAGFAVRYFAEPTPTPLVAFAGQSFEACASIVITASHNPPADNGYKVYAHNGVQIISPTDQEIAAEIRGVGPANEVPRALHAYESSEVVAIGTDLFESYLRQVAATLPEPRGVRDISIVYTPMHGVGGRFVMEALSRFGYRNVKAVAKQFAPDGTFPTVAFPNPEEPGALDLAHDLAAATDADLVLANDPDTDRLGVSVPVPGGQWRQLTGNQIGCLLAHYLLERGNHKGAIVVNSIVSTPMLGDIAAANGAVWHQSLTGFKWIWNAALDLSVRDGSTLVLGFEEALGYSVGTTVRDKDGISAALAFAALSAEAASDGMIVLDRLGDLYRAYGIWVSTQVSIRRAGSFGADDISAAMQRLRASPPHEIAGMSVHSVNDFETGENERPWYLGATNLVVLDLGAAGRVLARPSGTEPKLKIYTDLRTDFPVDGTWVDEEQRLLARGTEVGDSLASWLLDAMGGPSDTPLGKLDRLNT